MPCAVYENRPAWCRAFPSPGHAQPAECTVRFERGQQIEPCRPSVCGDACCATPRGVGGDNGAAYPGGPCRFLIPSE